MIILATNIRLSKIYCLTLKLNLAQMKKIFSITIILSFVCIHFAFSKKKDNVLLTIDNQPVTTSEFIRIYEKNNASASYDQESIADYLELFINFKLKVLEAKKLGYDTIPEFIKEYNKYKDQLIEPYLIDESEIERLVDEAAERSGYQVRASHILVRVDQHASPEDTLAAYKKIKAIYDRISKGESFDSVAYKESEDPSAKQNYGDLGYFGTFQMVYEFENMAYNTPLGKISKLFRSSFGYHILKVTDKREYPGDVKGAHIMVRTPKNASAEEIAQAREKIYDYYKRLQEGESFEELAKQYSDDVYTKDKGGDLGYFKPGTFPPEFENAIYAITDSGAFREPFRTDYGWHIVKFKGKKENPSLEKRKQNYRNLIRRSNRKKVADQVIIERIKNKYGYKEYPDNIDTLITLVNESVIKKGWDPSVADALLSPVFTIGDKDYSQKDLAHYLARKSYGRNVEISNLVYSVKETMVGEKALEYEKEKLPDQNQELKYLLEEYYDGILLFNLTDDMVWSKAIKDTSGLEKFYEENKENYTWDERAAVIIFSLTDSTLLDVANNLIQPFIDSSITVKEIKDSLCSDALGKCINIITGKYEKDDKLIEGKIEWQEGLYTVTDENKHELIYVKGFIEPGLKKFNEARGIITADYQNYLEKEWVKELREKHTITIDQKVLTKLQKMKKK